jgi:hypothetical protein
MKNDLLDRKWGWLRAWRGEVIARDLGILHSPNWPADFADQDWFHPLLGDTRHPPGWSEAKQQQALKKYG